MSNGRTSNRICLLLLLARNAQRITARSHNVWTRLLQLFLQLSVALQCRTDGTCDAVFDICIQKQLREGVEFITRSMEKARLMAASR